MFINKNVKSLKNVHKTKHHKRNKNKKRSIKKLSIKYMRGGSGASGASGAIIHIPTLLKLIHSKANTMCEIHYDDVKIICLLGNNNVKLGYDNIKKRGCIVIYYYKNKEDEKIYYNAKLDSFFFGMPKQKCLYSKNINSNSLRLINNSIVYEEQKRKKKSDIEYNKIINTHLLELVDTINILLGVIYCTLYDASTVDCNADFGISMILKNITRGYGFYNEFGYLYIEKTIVLNVDVDKSDIYTLLDLVFANKILEIIYKLSLTIYIYKDKDKNKNTDDDDGLIDEIFNHLKHQEYLTYKDIGIYIEHKCRDANTDIDVKNVVTSISKMLDTFINTINKMFIKNNILSMLTKRYEYLIDDTVSKSELIKEKNPVQDPPQKTPYHFAMVKYTKPTITITSLQEEQPPNPDEPHNPHKPRKPVYLITITKGTKIE